MAQTWTLADIRARVRKLAGIPSTSQESDSDIDDRINDYYQNRFPTDITDDLLRGVFTQELSATDDGKYSLSSDVLVIEEPVKVNSSFITFSQDYEKFFENFPDDTGQAYVISSAGAGLAQGVSSVSAVKNNAFLYRVSNTSYSQSAGETELSGDSVPQDKYGAWRLEVNAAGTVSIVEASGNATGYATPALAVDALTNEGGDNAGMGFITAISSSGAFVPGTTALNDANVTSTFTDGWKSSRNTPGASLKYDQEIYVRPKPNDWFELTAPYIVKPDALSSDSSVPLDVSWGYAIAYGTAIEILSDDGDDEQIAKFAVIFQRHINQINQKFTRQKNVNRRAKVRF